jgi:predicted permease
LRRARALDGLDEDIRDHIERETQDNIDRGMTPDEARRQALLAFGNLALVREDTRAIWIRRWADELRQDISYAFRTLRRNPGFTTVVVLTLALGIGANTAIFSLVETVLLRSLPVAQPDELVFLQTTGRDGTSVAPPYPYFDRLRDEASFAGIAAFATDELRITVDGTPEQVLGQVASGTYFDVLALTAAAGRLMNRRDEQLDPPVAVIGYGYWQRRFGGDPGAIGRTLSFGDRIFTIVGVTPPEFRGLDPGRQVDVTLPITQERAQFANAEAQWFNAVARLRPDVTLAQAAARTDATFQILRQEIDGAGSRARSRFERLQLTPASRGLGQLRARFSGPLYAMTLVAGVLLLIACVNLSILLLVRGAARRREFAVRLATGAGRGRLLRQVLTETLALCVLGAAAGLVIAYIAVQGLTALFAIGRRPILLDVHYDWTLVAFAAGVTLAAGLFTGVWPAVRALRTDPQTAMAATPSRQAGAGRLPAARILVAGQVALSLALMVAAVLFARTMLNLYLVDLGFNRTGVVTMSLEPGFPPGTPRQAREESWRRVVERVRGLPAVHAASLSVLTPLSGRNTGTILNVPGDETRHQIRLNHVSDDYFRTFGIPIVAGRAFAPPDATGARNVAMLNETAAKALANAFAGRSPIGERVELGTSGVYEVVGVVRDHKHLSVREQAPPFVFVPVWEPIYGLSRLTLSVSSDQPRASVIRSVADEVRAIRPQTLVSDIVGVEEQIDATLVSERLLSMLASGFAALVLGLAAIGLYGIVSFAVASRRTEFGVRLALGAPRSHVASGVVKGVLLHVAGGIAAGLPLALIHARLAERLLFGVTALDPANYAIGAGAMVAVACVAAWVPAQRACSIDPAETLRRA